MQRPDPGYRCPDCHGAFYKLVDNACPWCFAPYSEKKTKRAIAYAAELPAWSGTTPRPPKKSKRRFVGKVLDSATTLPLRVRVFERDGHACVYCGSNENLTIDHWVPRSKGGTNAIDNLATACRRCNHLKGDRMPDEPWWRNNISERDYRPFNPRERAA